MYFFLKKAASRNFKIIKNWFLTCMYRILGNIFVTNVTVNIASSSWKRQSSYCFYDIVHENCREF